MTPSFPSAIPEDPLPTLNAAGVAEKLLTTEKQFLRNAYRLCRDHGFPRDLPGLARRWSRAQVLAWIDNGGVFEAVPAAARGAAGIVKAAATELTRRYGGEP